jgi:pyruvate kinase
LNIPCLSKKDENDIVNFAIKQEVDFIAPSSIRKGQDVDTIRELLNSQESPIQIIAKINSQEALQNYDEILAAADGVMIQRSELSLEFPLEKVYVAQKWMIEKANISGKPVIINSQTLDSMIKAPRPSR